MNAHAVNARAGKERARRIQARGRRHVPARALRGARGFTLIEVLLATLLLAAGLALAFTTLRASTATAQRGEAISQQSERMRAVEGFLRRRIGSALQVAFDTDPTTGEQIRFVGSAGEMRFVADLPDYLGRGGPHLHDIRIDDAGGQARLVASFTTVVAGKPVEERQPRAPDPLVPDLVSATFRYRGLTAENQLADWTDEWKTPGQLPLQVSIEITSTAGGRWPRLVVALPQAGLQGSQGLLQ